MKKAEKALDTNCEMVIDQSNMDRVAAEVVGEQKYAAHATSTSSTHLVWCLRPTTVAVPAAVSQGLATLAFFTLVTIPNRFNPQHAPGVVPSSHSSSGRRSVAGSRSCSMRRCVWGSHARRIWIGGRPAVTHTCSVCHLFANGMNKFALSPISHSTLKAWEGWHLHVQDKLACFTQAAE